MIGEISLFPDIQYNWKCCRIGAIILYVFISFSIVNLFLNANLYNLDEIGKLMATWYFL